MTCSSAASLTLSGTALPPSAGTGVGGAKGDTIGAGPISALGSAEVVSVLVASSMAPTIVFDEAGKPWAALGSPGGSRIILYVVKTLVALIDWKLDAQEAASLMNFGSRGGPFEIEIDQPSAIWHALKVKPYGHRVSADLLNSGTHAIVLR